MSFENLSIIPNWQYSEELYLVCICSTLEFENMAKLNGYLDYLLNAAMIVPRVAETKI